MKRNLLSGAVACLFGLLLLIGGFCTTGQEKAKIEIKKATTRLARDEKKERINLGLNHHFLQYNLEEWREVLALLQQSGTKWVRMPIYWHEIEPQKGKWNFARLDAFVKDLHRARIRILGMLLGVPSWANGVEPTGEGPEGWATVYPPLKDEDWANFVSTIVRRYRGRISHWEIWNEENEYYFFRPQPDPARYLRMLKAAYRACKQADPASTIVLGGLAFNGIVANPWSPMKTENYLPALYKEGAKEYFDAVAIHPYFLPQEGLERLAYLLSGTKQAMKEAGDEGKPIWITEIGFAVNPALGVDEEAQARLLTEALNYLKKDPQIESVFVFTFQDWPRDIFGGEASMGLITWERRKKAAFLAYKKLAHEAN